MICIAFMGLLRNCTCLFLWGIAIALVVVLLGAFFCARIVRMKKALVFIGFAIFCLGCIVYLASSDYVGENEVTRSLAAATSSLSAFFPSRGGFDDSFFALKTCRGEVAPWPLRTAYWVFHLLAFFYVATIVISVFGANFCNKVWLALHLARKSRAPFNVFWNSGPESEAVAKDIAAKAGSQLENSADVVFVLHDKKKSWLGLRDDENVHAVARRRWR